MNSVTLVLILTVLTGSLAANAGIGGSSGGTAGMNKPEYVTAEVCDEEARCRQVTYRLREQSSTLPMVNSGAASACENPHSDRYSTWSNCVYKIPTWLKKLNTIFGDPLKHQIYDSNESNRN